MGVQGASWPHPSNRTSYASGAVDSLRPIQQLLVKVLKPCRVQASRRTSCLQMLRVKTTQVVTNRKKAVGSVGYRDHTHPRPAEMESVMIRSNAQSVPREGRPLSTYELMLWAPYWQDPHRANSPEGVSCWTRGNQAVAYTACGAWASCLTWLSIRFVT